jgi:plastocyanin
MPPAPAPTAVAAAIAIRNYAYDPPSIAVPAGTTLTWTNQDQDAHTVTGAGLKSSSLHAGESYVHTFASAGTFSYVCALHPQMKGTVVVE